MDYVGPIIGIVDMIFAPMWKCCNYYRGANKHRITLKEKWRCLELRKLDTIARMNAQLHPGDTPKQEVEGWLQDVEEMNKEIEAIEREAGEGKCFSRAHIGKIAFNKIQEVEKLYERGNFSNSLVVDPPIRNGEVLPLPPTLRGESTTKSVREEIWACMMDDNVRKIGVYGMGGIGKSTIMKQINNLLLKETDKFDSVVWVTMSKEFSVGQLQNDIAKKLNIKFEIDDVTTRAAKLMEALEKMKRCVLILDDMWEAFALEEVGIPEPTLENGCKLVLTTRLRDVCRRMSCEEIKMELLSEEEARKLFSDRMGYDVFKNPDKKAIAEEVLQTCAQLPLAIVATAASFKCLDYEYQWTDALDKLSTSLEGFDNIEGKVQEVLKFSYVQLKEEKLRQCLLHCALYPEDFSIDKKELIDHLIDEGIFERRKSRKFEFRGGYSILKKLENASLLEGGIDGPYNHEEKFVKMHDLIRDMVLQVASPEFMVGHLGLEDFSDEGKWKEDLVKASLMYKDISTIPSNISPRCPNLSTLLLQCNRSLKNVPDSLFVHLHGLKVLDLSYTGIESLPNSVFSLENLTALRLRGCRRLKHMSSLAKLTALRKLDLGETKITEVPDGLEMLVKLTYLNLNAKNLKIMPLRILPKLSRLQYLRFSPMVKVKKEEIESLKKLENVWVRFDDLDEFCSFIRFLEERQLAYYQIQVGKSVEDFDQKIGDVEKIVILEDCNLRRGGDSLELPEDLQFLNLKTCEDLRSLCDVPSLKHVRELKKIRIEDCEGIEHVVSSTSRSYSDSLPTLEILELLNLKNLRGLFRKERAASARVPLDTFSSLKVILIDECPMKKLLPLGLLLHLHNLEEIQVENCLELEEIIAEACDEFEEDEEEKDEKGMDTTKITLPKLRYLTLSILPVLKTICSSSKVIVCDSLETIKIYNCPNLKRLPLSLPRLSNGQLSPPPSLKEIGAYDKRWWESLEWDCPDTKDALQPFIHNSAYPYYMTYHYVRSDENPNACTIC